MVFLKLVPSAQNYGTGSTTYTTPQPRNSDRQSVGISRYTDGQSVGISFYRQTAPVGASPFGKSFY